MKVAEHVKVCVNVEVRMRGIAQEVVGFMLIRQ